MGVARRRNAVAADPVPGDVGRGGERQRGRGHEDGCRNGEGKRTSLCALTICCASSSGLNSTDVALSTSLTGSPRTLAWVHEHTPALGRGIRRLSQRGCQTPRHSRPRARASAVRAVRDTYRRCHLLKPAREVVVHEDQVRNLPRSGWGEGERCAGNGETIAPAVRADDDGKGRKGVGTAHLVLDPRDGIFAIARSPWRPFLHHAQQQANAIGGGVSSDPQPPARPAESGVCRGRLHAPASCWGRLGVRKDE